MALIIKFKIVTVIGCNLLGYPNFYNIIVIKTGYCIVRSDILAVK